MEIPFDLLTTSELNPGCTLCSGPSGLAGEPLNKLFGAGNQGGFRIRGGAKSGYKLAVLYTTFKDPDWPDSMDSRTGIFTYYGDNKDSGRALLETPKHGNRLLQDVFEIVHAAPERRADVPPFFVVSRAGHRRDAVYHGLAAPGATNVPETEDLVAIWKTRDRHRFQNYRAIFSMLDAPAISANWIRDLRDGNGSMTANAPAAWKNWVETGAYC
jgi:hypothetical protein